MTYIRRVHGTNMPPRSIVISDITGWMLPMTIKQNVIRKRSICPHLFWIDLTSLAVNVSEAHVDTNRPIKVQWATYRLI